MKTIRILFFLIAFIGSAAISKAQFREVYTGSNMNNDIKWTSFLTASTGFVSFTYHIGFTSDSGHSYSLRPVTLSNVNFNGYSPDVTLGFTSTGVKALTTDSLFAFGHYTSQPAIIFSEDGGYNWKLVYHSGNGGDLYNKIFDLSFPVNNSTGFAIQHDKILRSFDRGQHWTWQGSGIDMENLHFPTATTGYVSGGNNILRTTNTGDNWYIVSRPTGAVTGNFNNIFFVNANTGYVTDALSDAVYRTTNSGNAWTKMNDNILIPIDGSDMYFTDDSTGFICKEFQRQVYKTSDRGRTWERCRKTVENQYLGYGFYKIQALNDQFWAPGAGEYLMLATGNTPVNPSAFFKIDTTNYSSTSIINLKNHSRTGYSYQWFRNDTLVSTSYNASYMREAYPLRDTIKLVVESDNITDTAVLYQSFAQPQPAPVITSFCPASGGQLTQVFINGSGFTGANSVKFGGVPAYYFQVVSNTLIYAWVGIAGATGAVTVSKPASAAGVLPGFLFHPVPAITGVSPASAGVGETVSLTGAHFNPEPAGNHVFFGTARAEVLSATGNSLSVKVPNAATFDRIYVTPNTYTANTEMDFNVTFPDPLLDSTSYGTSTNIAAGKNTRDVIAGDIDGDGRPDLAVTCRNSNAIFIYRNTGSGNTLGMDTAILISFPYFQARPVRIIMTDRDGDGKLDLITTHNYTGGLTYLRNTSTPGNISFAPYSGISGGNDPIYDNISIVESLGADDINRDGKADFAINRHYGGNVNVYVTRRTCAGPSWNGYHQVTNVPATGLAFRDIDGDSIPDLVQAGLTSLAIRRINSLQLAAASWHPAVTFPSPANPSSKKSQVAVADLDNDGKRDIIVTDSEGGTIYIYKNTSVPGSVTLNNYLSFAAEGAADVEVADMNGDGKPDILVTCLSTNKLLLFKNISTNGTISLAPPIAYNTGAGPEGITVADLNADNIPEVIVANTLGNSISILKNFAHNNLVLCTGTSSATLFANDRTAGTYQWQADTTGAGFVDITDGAYFTGTQGRQLQLNNIAPGWHGYKFRCVAGGNTEEMSELKFINYWTGASGTSWNDPLNWSCGVVPSNTTDVIINKTINNVTVGTNITIGSITIKPGGSILFSSNARLTVSH